MTNRPDTIVLVHGLWMTPRSWEGWVAHFEAKGFTVLTPAYPGFEIEVEALRENPDVIANLTVPETVDHLTAVVESAATRRSSWATRSAAHSPSCCSPSGLGCAGVVVDSAPTEGVRVNPISQAKSLFPALKNPANRHKAVGFTAGGVPLRVHQHPHRGGLPKGLGALRHPRTGQLGLGVRPVRELQARTPGHLGRLQRRPGAAAVHRRREGPHHAAVGEQVERQALQALAGDSPTTTSSRAATTGHAPRPAGRRSPTIALDWALDHAQTDRPWVAA